MIIRWYKTYRSLSQNIGKLQSTLPWTIMKYKRIMGLRTFKEKGEKLLRNWYMLWPKCILSLWKPLKPGAAYASVFIKRSNNVLPHDILHFPPNYPVLIPVGFWTISLISLINFYSDLGYQYFHCYSM